MCEERGQQMSLEWSTEVGFQRGLFFIELQEIILNINFVFYKENSVFCMKNRLK